MHPVNKHTPPTTLLTHLTNPPYQPTLSIHPINPTITLLHPLNPFHPPLPPTHPHLSRLRAAVRLELPLNTIVTVRAVGQEEVALAVQGCYPLIVSTFSRQYVVLVRLRHTKRTCQ